MSQPETFEQIRDMVEERDLQSWMREAQSCWTCGYATMKTHGDDTFACQNEVGCDGLRSAGECLFCGKESCFESVGMTDIHYCADLCVAYRFCDDCEQAMEFISFQAMSETSPGAEVLIPGNAGDTFTRSVPQAHLTGTWTWRCHSCSSTFTDVVS